MLVEDCSVEGLPQGVDLVSARGLWSGQRKARLGKERPASLQCRLRGTMALSMRGLLQGTGW